MISRASERGPANMMVMVGSCTFGMNLGFFETGFQTYSSEYRPQFWGMRRTRSPLIWLEAQVSILNRVPWTSEVPKDMAHIHFM